MTKNVKNSKDLFREWARDNQAEDQGSKNRTPVLTGMLSQALMGVSRSHTASFL